MKNIVTNRFWDNTKHQNSSSRKKIKTTPSPDILKQPNTSSNETQDNVSSKNLETQEMTEFEQILQSAKELFCNPSKPQPISFENLVDLFQQAKKPKEFPKYIAEYTNNTDGLIKLFDQTYQKIKNKNIRNLISRMKKAISEATNAK